MGVKPTSKSAPKKGFDFSKLSLDLKVLGDVLCASAARRKLGAEASASHYPRRTNA